MVASWKVGCLITISLWIMLAGCAVTHPKYSADLQDRVPHYKNILILTPNLSVEIKYYQTEHYVKVPARTRSAEQQMIKGCLQNFKEKGLHSQHYKLTAVKKTRKLSEKKPTQAPAANKQEVVETNSASQSNQQKVSPAPSPKEETKTVSSKKNDRASSPNSLTAFQKELEHLNQQMILQDLEHNHEVLEVNKLPQVTSLPKNLEKYDAVVYIYGRAQLETDREFSRRWVGNVISNLILLPVSLANFIVPAITVPITVSTSSFSFKRSPDNGMIYLVFVDTKDKKLVYRNDYFIENWGFATDEFVGIAEDLLDEFPESNP